MFCIREGSFSQTDLEAVQKPQMTKDFLLAPLRASPRSGCWALALSP